MFNAKDCVRWVSFLMMHSKGLKDKEDFLNLIQCQCKAVWLCRNLGLAGYPEAPDKEGV